MPHDRPATCDALVLYGASGDLAAKMLFPALARLALDGVRIPIVGVAHADTTPQALLARVHERLVRDDPKVAPTLSELNDRVAYVAGDLGDDATYEALQRTLGNAQRPLHYLAIPPNLFATVVQGLARNGLARGSRIALEKPFGHDLESARALERVVEHAFPAGEVFRIDHFLGKDPLRNLADLRGHAAWLEPLWSHAHVRSVQISMAEAFGITARGAFYEKVGALRDVFQNHILQIVALIAMEPAPPSDPQAYDAARVEALRAVAPIAPGDVVYGQYEGYRDEGGVAPESRVETYVAARVQVDTPRFAGVPFVIRAGKRLPLTATTASLALTRARSMREDVPTPVDHLRFRLGPGAVDIAIDTHRLVEGSSDEHAPLTLKADLPRDEDRDAYVNLLRAALRGDDSMSERAAGVTAAWRVVEPLLRADIPVYPYARGSWGPREAERLLPDGERWYDALPEA
jgi:glucose-6-phosphate 1-dehydrogenase